ncbi:MAG TPA: GspH/FimT family pseudopilin [Steroidobacteraceae bacterium]|nr:GspH/FimT family pseudopilin [Steroidobacteraceae bacterium]
MRQPTTTRLDAAHTGSPPQGGPARQSGMTLMELIIVMVLVGILVAIGVPSYRSVTNSSRMSGEANSLLGDLQYARAEAAREGEPVTVCISANGTSCDAASTSWQEGWIIFTDINDDQTVDNAGDTVLRVQRAFSGSDTFQSNNTDYAVTFTREGFATVGGNSLIISLHNTNTPGSNYYYRCLEISQAGMMSIQSPSTDAANCT